MGRDEAEGIERTADFIEVEICLLWFEVAEHDECNYVSFYVMGAKQGRRESGPMVYFDLQKRRRKKRLSELFHSRKILISEVRPMPWL